MSISEAGIVAPPAAGASCRVFIVSTTAPCAFAPIVPETPPPGRSNQKTPAFVPDRGRCLPARLNP